MTFTGELDSHLNKLYAIHFVVLCHRSFNLIRRKQIAFKQTLDMITQTIARMVRRKYFDLPISKGKLVKTILLVAKVVTLKQIVYSYLYYLPNNHTEKMNELITS